MSQLAETPADSAEEGVGTPVQAPSEETPAKEQGSAPSPAGEDAPLLEHEYDGIREYDNPLPGWWVALFWITVLLSPWYVAIIHGGEGRLVEDEYAAEAAEVAQKRAEEALKNPVTNESLLALVEDESSIAYGAQVFATKCVTCHGPEGQGKIGPNLTDDFWILGDEPTRIYETVNVGGRAGKGMRAWGKELSAEELRKVTAFVISIRGSDPNDPKAPEGERSTK